MFVVSVEFRIKTGHEEAFRTAVLAQARNSLEREAGCQQFDVAVAPEDGRRIFLYEVYTDEGAFEAHKATAHCVAFLAAVEPWTEVKQVATWTRLAPAV